MSTEYPSADRGLLPIYEQRFLGVSSRSRTAARWNIAAFWSSFFCINELPLDCCWICGVCEVIKGDIHRAHIIPHRSGGTGGAWNLALTCAGCNDAAEIALQGPEERDTVFRHVKAMPVVAGEIAQSYWAKWCPFVPTDISPLESGIVALCLREAWTTLALSVNSVNAARVFDDRCGPIFRLMVASLATSLWLQDAGCGDEANAVREWLGFHAQMLGVFKTPDWDKAVRRFRWKNEGEDCRGLNDAKALMRGFRGGLWTWQRACSLERSGSVDSSADAIRRELGI